MNRRKIKTYRVTGIACVLLLACAAGCQDKKTEPKRADHKLAHAARYHPDVQRIAPPTGPSTQPGNQTQPEQTTPLHGPVGCPVLFVNDDTITVQEILEPLMEELERHARALSPAEYRESLLRSVSRYIESQIGMLLVYQEAKKAYTAEEAKALIDKEADRWVQEMVTRRFGGVQARYEAHLKRLNLSAENMKERAKQEVMFRMFLHERIHPMLSEPPRHELMKYYQAHLGDFTTPAEAEMSLIEVPLATELGKPISEATAEQVAQARQQIHIRLGRAREELESGIDFATVAKAYSKGINAARGGAWGKISPDTLKQRWAKPAEILFSLKPGQFSEVLDSEESVFIVKCSQCSPRQQISFEQAQEKIINQLLDEQFTRLRNKYIMKLLKRSTIRKRNEFIQAVLAAAPRPKMTQAGAAK